MNVELVSARPDDAPVLSRLFQLYVYDFSEILELESRDDGLFEFGKPEGYWNAPRYVAFLIRVGSHLAGFAIVDSESRLTHEALWDVNQFFVLRRYRRAGVGARAAMALFDRFRGRWEVHYPDELLRRGSLCRRNDRPARVRTDVPSRFRGHGRCEDPGA